MIIFRSTRAADRRGLDGVGDHVQDIEASIFYVSTQYSALLLPLTLSRPANNCHYSGCFSLNLVKVSSLN
jgi:hypothetical protein